VTITQHLAAQVKLQFPIYGHQIPQPHLLTQTQGGRFLSSESDSVAIKENGESSEKSKLPQTSNAQYPNPPSHPTLTPTPQKMENKINCLRESVHTMGGVPSTQNRAEPAPRRGPTPRFFFLFHDL
jgi:hypothetical protein